MRYILGLVTLLSLPALTFADSDKPVCKGFSIGEKYRGLWKNAEGKPALDLTTTMAFVEDEESGAQEMKAWTCTTKGHEYIVFKFGEAKDFPDGNFESRLISRAGFQLMMGGEAYVTENGIEVFGSKTEILTR